MLSYLAINQPPLPLLSLGGSFKLSLVFELALPAMDVRYNIPFKEEEYLLKLIQEAG